MKILMALVLAGASVCAGAQSAVKPVAVDSAPTGVIPRDQELKIRAALEAARQAQLAAMVAQQVATAANVKIVDAVNLAKTAMDLDLTWDFNPKYSDPKSADYHVLKFVKRPEPVAPPPPAPAPAASAPAAKP